MKKLLSLLVVLFVFGAALHCNAQSEYVYKGLKNTQEQYVEFIETAIEKSEYTEEEIDKEHIFVIENTSPIPMRNNEETIWIYVALPITGTSDIAFAHFNKGEYVSEITNFTVFENIENPYENKLQQYIENNKLSEPTAITNLWLIERLHLFAYKVVCKNDEYIIPYHFTEDTMFNLTENEDCNIEIGKAYTREEFLTICDKEAEKFAEYRKSENDKQKENTSYVYVDNDGEVSEKTEKEPKIAENDKIHEEKLGDGTPAKTYSFEELTGLSREKIDHIVIRSGVDGVGYSTAYEKVITDIYNTINTKTFLPYVQEGNSGGWKYEILFFDENNKGATYNMSKGITPKSGHSGLSYRTTNETELVVITEKAYGLIANDCSNWAADYIVEAKDLGFLDDVTEIQYKEPVTREKFCEIIYNMLDKTMDIKWKKVSPNPFRDTVNEKINSLCLEGLIKGKGDGTFAPDDYLTREEAATIIDRIYKNGVLYGTGTTGNWVKFSDESEISDWALYGVQNACKQGVMLGTSEGKFAPKEIYTTEQAITSIVRMYHQNYKDK